jgi:peptidoglycan/LPS O-acetylase OafA/YrhL
MLVFLVYHFLMPTSEVKWLLEMMLLGLTTVAVAYTGVGAATRMLRGNDLSYGVYIYHGLILNVFVELGLTGGIHHFVGFLAITCVVAGLSWVLVERPFILRKRQSLAPTSGLGRAPPLVSRLTQ